MRLLITTAGDIDQEFGGGQVYTRNLVSAQSEAGHEVEAVGNRTAIQSAIVQARPDLVHAHGWKAVAARAAEEYGVPCIVTMHHGGLLRPGGALLDRGDRICRRAAEQSLCTACCLRGRWWGSAPPGIGRLLRRLPNIPFVTPAMTRPLGVNDKLTDISSLRRDVTLFVAPSAAVQDALIQNGVPRETHRCSPSRNKAPAISPDQSIFNDSIRLRRKDMPREGLSCSCRGDEAA